MAGRPVSAAVYRPVVVAGVGLGRAYVPVYADRSFWTLDDALREARPLAAKYTAASIYVCRYVDGERRETYRLDGSQCGVGHSR